MIQVVKLYPIMCTNNIEQSIKIFKKILSRMKDKEIFDQLFKLDGHVTEIHYVYLI